MPDISKPTLGLWKPLVYIPSLYLSTTVEERVSRLITFDKQKWLALSSGAIWLFLDKFLKLILSMSLGVMIARHLQPQDYGYLTVAITTVAFLQTICGLGIENLVIRDLASQRLQPAQILTTVFQCKLCCGIFLWITVTVSSAFLYGSTSRDFQLLSVIGLSLIFQAADTVDFYFQSQSRNASIMKVRILSQILSNGFRLILLYSKAPLIYFAIALAVDSLIQAFAQAILFFFQGFRYSFAFETKYAKALLKESFPFLLSNISIILYTRIDQILISKFLGADSLGYYAVAVSWSQACTVLPAIAMIILSPLMAKKKSISDFDYKESLRKIYAAFSCVSIVVSITMFFLSNYLIFALYGPSFRRSSEILRIIVFSNIFIFLGMAQHIWIVNEGKGKIIFVKTAIGALLSLAGNYFFLPIWGLAAAGYTMVMAQAISSVFLNYFLDKHSFNLQLSSLIWPLKKFCFLFVKIGGLRTTLGGLLK